jgi:hypothetical protein
MESRGGVTGGATVGDFLADFAVRGYSATFQVRPDGKLECSRCHAWMPADEVPLQSMRRVEGSSDPADMSAVAAMQCPRCGALGTAAFCFGPHCPPEDAEVLRRLQHDERESRVLMSEAPGPDDSSLVRDTGWLDGPNEG